MSEASRKTQSKDTPDGKPRGANRSTKVAGKLKVLPEQPEPLPLLGPKSTGGGLSKPRSRDHARAESTGTTGDSDDGDVEEVDDSQEEDVAVCVFFA